MNAYSFSFNYGLTSCYSLKQMRESNYCCLCAEQDAESRGINLMSDRHLGFAAVHKLHASYSKVVRQEPSHCVRLI